MYTTKKAAQLAGIGRSTVPHYAREWADYLGEAAQVQGKTRYFSDDDIAVFRTVKVLRDQNTPTEEIRAFLDDGNRAEPLESPPEPPETPPDNETDETRALAPIELFERILEPFQDRIDTLENDVKAERAARVNAEKRAERLAGRLDAIYRRHPWQFWKPERPPEDD